MCYNNDGVPRCDCHLDYKMVNGKCEKCTDGDSNVECLGEHLFSLQEFMFIPHFFVFNMFIALYIITMDNTIATFTIQYRHQKGKTRTMNNTIQNTI